MTGPAPPLSRQTADDLPKTTPRRDVTNAASQIIAAQANLTTVAQNLKRSVVVAPFAGTIGISNYAAHPLVA